ncbi:MAG: hypothetical protein D6731_20220, partial [Planctomycetota bacterium]
ALPAPEPLPPEPEPLPPEPEPALPAPEPTPPAPAQEPALPAPAVSEEAPAVPPPLGSETIRQRDARVARSMARLDDFAEFRRSRRDPDDGPIPGILLTNTDARELLDVVAHFDLFPIAFRRSEPARGYVAIDFARGQMQPTKDFDYISERYAKNTMYIRGPLRRNPLFRSAARELIRRFGIPARDLEVCFLVPRPFMAYLNWKAFKTCEQAGVDPAAVRVCKGALVRRGRTWVLRVEEFAMKDGRQIPVRGTG